MRDVTGGGLTLAGGSTSLTNSSVLSEGLMSNNISSVNQQYLTQPLSYYNLAKLSNHLTGFLLNEGSLSDLIDSV